MSESVPQSVWSPGEMFEIRPEWIRVGKGENKEKQTKEEGKEDEEGKEEPQSGSRPGQLRKRRKKHASDATNGIWKKNNELKKTNDKKEVREEDEEREEEEEEG